MSTGLILAFRFRRLWFLLAFVTQVLSGCSEPRQVTSDGVRPVKTMIIARGEGQRTRVFSGRADASRRVELAFQVSGLLENLPVSEGERVKKGDLIAQLRQDEFEARLKTLQGQLEQGRAELAALRLGVRPEVRRQREADVRAAEARLNNARTELDRYARLLPRRAVSQAEYDTAETRYRVALEDLEAARQVLEEGSIAREEDILAQEAQVRALEGRVVEADIQLRDSTLRAPYDGVIAQRFVEQGQTIQAKEPVVRFQDVEEIEIVVDVPESVMTTDIRTADIVQMLAEFTGGVGREFPVDIREVSKVADPVTQTFQVRTAMQSPSDMQVLPGMTANVRVVYRRANVLGDPIMVPISAIHKESSGEQVAWVLGPNQSVTRRPVKLGEAAGGQVEIVEGLNPGDRIAVAGVTFLREGMKVRDLGDALGGGA